MKKTMVFLILALFLASCSAPSTPKPGFTNTRTPTPSLTAAPALSPTPTASTTPEPALSPSPTQTPGGTGTLSCALLSQSVKNGSHHQPLEQFSIGWKVRNTGTAGWIPGAVEFTYIGGTKMYQYPRVQLLEIVDPGNVAILSADLRAPRNQGRYSITWSLRQGDTYFCHIGLTIFVP